jgi:putative FmdB family regulatory protein
MPEYSYKCSACGHGFKYVSTISRRNEPQSCPQCEKASPRDIEAELAPSRACDVANEDHPRWSWALGINADNPQEVAEARIRHPDAVFNDKGQMFIRNRQEKLRRMHEANYDEY